MDFLTKKPGETDSEFELRLIFERGQKLLASADEGAPKGRKVVAVELRKNENIFPEPVVTYEQSGILPAGGEPD